MEVGSKECLCARVCVLRERERERERYTGFEWDSYPRSVFVREFECVCGWVCMCVCSYVCVPHGSGIQRVCVRESVSD